MLSYLINTPLQSLRGPRGGMIFFKREPVVGVDLESAINIVVFPGLQVVSNSRALANRLIELGYKLVSGGTGNHLVLVDLRPLGIDGACVERILDMASIILNKNSVPSNKSSQVPGGIRIGSPIMTTRGFTKKEFIATDFIHKGVKIALEAKRSVSGSKLRDFMKFFGSPDFSHMDQVSGLRKRVEALTTEFPLPGL